MDQQGIIQALNEAISLEVRSFMLYVRDVATPMPGREDVGETLAKIAEDETRFAGEIADLVEGAGGKMDFPVFPMSGCAYHYLDSDYLLPICTEKLREGLEAFREITARFEGHPEIQAVLSRIADAKASHLALLEDLVTHDSSIR